MNNSSVRRLVGVLLSLGVFATAVVAQPANQAPLITLFDGSSLAAWKGYQSDTVPAGWVIDDGSLKHESGMVDLVTRDSFSDFDLQFEWRIAPGANSGVIYRAAEDESASYLTGPEFQLVDNEGWQLGSQHPQASGALYGLYPPSQDADLPVGAWNSGRILAQHGHVEHWLNGKLVVTADLDSDAWRAKVDGSKFANWKRFGTLSEGRIALQAHPARTGEIAPVWFRNIKIRRLENSQARDANQ
jgi:3-keto-disaccharide hydrolase